jgi:hypothetical protein
MFTGTTITFLIFSTAAAENRVAMLLAVKGQVRVVTENGETRSAKVMDLLSDKERLSVPADGAATLIFLGDDHRERVNPGAQVTIGPGGCTPQKDVERREPLGAGVAYQDVNRLSGSGQMGVAVLRDATPVPSIPLIPMYGSTVLTNRPTLAWRARRDAAVYQVRLMSGRLDKVEGNEQTLWTVQTNSTRLTYPQNEKPLLFGNIYSWQVSVREGDKGERIIAEGQFSVATRAEVTETAKVRKLTAGEDPADLLLAALAYHDYGAYDEAMSLFEQLAKQLPREPRFQFALAYYYTRAGRLEEAKKAREQAGKLSSQTPAK